MYALRVRINEETPILAGADDLGVLNAIVGCTGPLGTAAVPVRAEQQPEFFISLGGLTSRPRGIKDEHVHWLSHQPLRSGDRITVEIVEAEAADPPIGGEEAAQRESDEREFYEHCKSAYLGLRDKYEPTP